MVSCRECLKWQQRQESYVVSIRTVQRISLFRTEEDYEAMFELIQPTAIGWAPDVGHIENGGMSAIEQMKAHRDLIRHVHFKDRIAQNEWAVMGEGKIDYPAIIKSAEISGPDADTKETY